MATFARNTACLIPLAPIAGPFHRLLCSFSQNVPHAGHNAQLEYDNRDRQSSAVNQPLSSSFWILARDWRILCPIPDSCVRFRNLASVFQFLRPIWNLGAGFQKRTQDLQIGDKNPKTDARFWNWTHELQIGRKNSDSYVRFAKRAQSLEIGHKNPKTDARFWKRTQDFEIYSLIFDLDTRIQNRTLNFKNGR